MNRSASSCPRRKCRFLRSRIGLDLANKSRSQQTSIFLYAREDEADDKMTTINVDEDTVDPDYFVKVFDLYFDERKNLTVVHAKFSKRTKKPRVGAY